MEAITKGEADYAVLPIENSTAGIVSVYLLIFWWNIRTISSVRQGIAGGACADGTAGS